jgi:prepilin-type processing-associated H-X9-DG protein
MFPCSLGNFSFVFLLPKKILPFNTFWLDPKEICQVEGPQINMLFPDGHSQKCEGKQKNCQRNGNLPQF